MFFDYSRFEGLPTQYEEVRHPVNVDVLEAGLITAYLILLISLLFSQIRRDKFQAFWNCTRLFISLTIGLFILLSNFGQDWEVDQITTKTPYKAGYNEEINATIGIRIGLRSVNVTLKSDVPSNSTLKDEMIDYNERFHWSEPWDQGRFGFGPYAGQIQREFREGQYKGLPTPILWIIDYFVIDGEGFRFGRFYRTAGWYSHILIWTSFATWIVANILFKSVIEYGAYFLGITGILQLIGNLIWFCVRNPYPLKIPFEDDTLKPAYGFSYWLTFANGIFCLTLSIVIFVLDRFFDIPLHRVFDVDPLNYYEIAYITSEEKQLMRRKTRTDTNAEDTLEMIDVNTRDRQMETQQVFIRRTMMGGDFKNLMKTRRDSTYYENFPLRINDRQVIT